MCIADEDVISSQNVNKHPQLFQGNVHRIGEHMGYGLCLNWLNAGGMGHEWRYGVWGETRGAGGEFHILNDINRTSSGDLVFSVFQFDNASQKRVK